MEKYAAQLMSLCVLHVCIRLCVYVDAYDSMFYVSMYVICVCELVYLYVLRMCMRSVCVCV
jgi:hypothetical protein